MAVFRVEWTRDYTVMCTHHLKDTNLSLKAKGLLSLPDKWNYTTRGLAAIGKESVDATGSALREWRRRATSSAACSVGRASGPDMLQPDTGNPDAVVPDANGPYADQLYGTNGGGCWREVFQRHGLPGQGQAGYRGNRHAEGILPLPAR